MGMAKGPPGGHACNRNCIFRLKEGFGVRSVVQLLYQMNSFCQVTDFQFSRMHSFAAQFLKELQASPEGLRGGNRKL